MTGPLLRTTSSSSISPLAHIDLLNPADVAALYTYYLATLKCRSTVTVFGLSFSFSFWTHTNLLT